MFVVFGSPEAASEALAALPVPGEDAALAPTSLAGLPGLWGVWDEDYTELVVTAGSVMMLITDAFMADGARTHLTVAVGNVLLNAHHVLRHLFMATREALGLD